MTEKQPSWAYNQIWLEYIWGQGLRVHHTDDGPHWADNSEFNRFTSPKQGRYKTVRDMMEDNGYTLDDDCGCWLRGPEIHDFCPVKRPAHAIPAEDYYR